MTQQWNDYLVANDPDDPPIDAPAGQHFVRVVMTTDGLMTAWMAGPSRAFRVPAPVTDHPPIKVTCTNPQTGQREGRYESFTQQDQQTNDEFVNFGLRRADIPDIPTEFEWYVLAPQHISNGHDLEDALRAKNSAPDEHRTLAIISDTYNDLVR